MQVSIEQTSKTTSVFDKIISVCAVVVVSVMEGGRRRVGWMLFMIVSVFLFCALFADKIPGRLIGKELSPERSLQFSISG
jgi:TRAP-type uncharacterized transport system fused permease subunit